MSFGKIVTCSCLTAVAFRMKDKAGLQRQLRELTALIDQSGALHDDDAFDALVSAACANDPGSPGAAEPKAEDKDQLIARLQEEISRLGHELHRAKSVNSMLTRIPRLDDEQLYA